MKRYKHYKDSGIEWIGEIPEHWERYRIKYMLSRYISGVWGNNPKGDDNDIVCFRISDFDYVHGYLKFDNITIRNIDSKQLKGKLSKKGDLIIEKSGGGNLWPVGRVVRVNSNLRATCSNFAYLISVCNNISSNYLYYYFYCMYARGANLLYFNQTTGIQNLNIQEYLGQEIYIPIFSEQQSIADYLDKKCGLIDRMIDNLQKKIELLKELKSSVISQAVTKGLAPYVKMKDSGIEWIGEIPEHWEICRLKVFCNMKTGTTPKFYDDNTSSNKVDWFTPGDFSENFILADSKRKLDKESFDKCHLQLIPANSVLLVGIGATAGKSACNEKPCYFNQQITALICKKNIDYFYLMLILRHLKDAMIGNAFFTTLPILNNAYLSNIRIPYPPLSQQKLIAQFINIKISKIHSTVTKAQRKIDLLKEYKTALISEVVTGKRKVSA